MKHILKGKSSRANPNDSLVTEKERIHQLPADRRPKLLTARLAFLGSFQGSPPRKRHEVANHACCRYHQHRLHETPGTSLGRPLGSCAGRKRFERIQRVDEEDDLCQKAAGDSASSDER